MHSINPPGAGDTKATALMGANSNIDVDIVTSPGRSRKHLHLTKRFSLI